MQTDREKTLTNFNFSRNSSHFVCLHSHLEPLLFEKLSVECDVGHDNFESNVMNVSCRT